MDGSRAGGGAGEVGGGFVAFPVTFGILGKR